MVNSSWTSAHIQQLWWSLKEPALVYPPCDTSDLQLLPLDRKLKHLYLVSVAQFRPEKNHRLQLEAFALARQRAAGACCAVLVGCVQGLPAVCVF
jgi:alpha-1,2-mannosyltransferase